MKSSQPLGGTFHNRTCTKFVDFIHRNLLDSRAVGDTTTLLLATIPNSSKRISFDDMVTIRYYLVAKHYFHTITIDVRTNVGGTRRV